MRKLSFILVTLAALAGSGASEGSEERWLIATEAGAGRALSAPQSSDFGLGVSGSVGVLRSVAPWLSVGAAVRASLLTTNGAPRSDPSWAAVETGALYSVTGAIRVSPFRSVEEESRSLGLWLEGNSGGGVTGGRVRPVVGGALGYNLAFGAVAVGPMARYEQLVHFQDPLSSEDARLLIGGLQLVFLDAPEVKPMMAPVISVVVTKPAEAPLPPPAPETQALDADDDGIADSEDKCPLEAEVLNGYNDHDGCPDEEKIEFVADRLVLEGRVLFRTNRSKLKRKSARTLEAIAMEFQSHPDWVSMRIEGHADVRGEEEYNLELSRKRAEAVKRALVMHGVAASRLETVGYGETRPIDLRRTLRAHRRNRRVEFVVTRKVPVEAPSTIARGENAAAVQNGAGR